MQIKKGEVARSFDELVPRPLVSSSTTPEGLIVLLRPKVTNPFWRRLLPRRWREAVFRIKLDSLGSAVWQKIDGLKSVSQIALDLNDEWGEQIQPLEPRLKKFLTQLHQAQLIEYLYE